MDRRHALPILRDASVHSRRCVCLRRSRCRCRPHAERVKDLAIGRRACAATSWSATASSSASTARGDQTSQTPFTDAEPQEHAASSSASRCRPSMNPQLKNVAAVMVTAELPPFAKPGQTIDVTVSSIGNADEPARRHAADDAAARRRRPGLRASRRATCRRRLRRSGKDGSRITVNVPTPAASRTARPSSARSPTPSPTAVRDAQPEHSPDFTTAAHYRRRSTSSLGAGTARADRWRLRARARAGRCRQRIAYLRTLEVARDRAGRCAGARHREFAHRHRRDRLARARDAGGGRARLAVGHHHRARGCQPARSVRRTARRWSRRASTSTVNQPTAPHVRVRRGRRLNEIVRAVNQVGAAPGDLVAILEALKQAGALRADLQVI